MEIISDPDKERWDRFVVDNSSPSSFLQSWEWGEFQRALGNKIYRVAAVGDSGTYEAIAQAVVRPLYLGKTYLEVAKGPVIEIQNAKFKMQNLFDELVKIARQENAVMIRINPPYTKSQFDIPSSTFQIPKILLRQREPEDTVLVDLTKSEDELLAKMHEKSRYNIRLAIKKGVLVEEKTGDRQAFEKFLELIEETSKRDGITVWPCERFEKFAQFFLAPGGRGEGEGESPRAILLTGEYEGKVLAAAIVMLFGDSGTYLYAASSAEHRNANVPSLVLWKAFRRTKAAGKKYYDMWGIAPDGAGENHPWSGITRFKTRYITVGETGVEKHFFGTRDLILDKKFHLLFRIAKKLR